jgi:hypothetical protein
MIVCESEFEDPDPQNPGYSFTEVDFYAWIPWESQQRYGVENHRLSLRKNLKTGEYEVYRAYMERKLIARGGLVVITNEPMEAEEAAFRSKSLKEALAFANAEVRRFHGHDPRDEVCRHRWPKRALLCRVGRHG